MAFAVWIGDAACALEADFKVDDGVFVAFDRRIWVPSRLRQRWMSVAAWTLKGRSRARASRVGFMLWLSVKAV